MEYYSAIKGNASVSVLMNWMNLGPIIQSEVSQKREDKYHILTHICQRRQWHPTPVLLPGKFHGWGSLVGYSSWGHKELDTTEQLHFLCFYSSFWRRKWQPTQVFLPGESHGQRSLVGYSPCGCKESDISEQLTLSHCGGYRTVCIYENSWNCTLRKVDFIVYQLYL